MICAKMGKAGKEKFQREFTLEKFENRMKRYFKRMYSFIQEVNRKN